MKKINLIFLIILLGSMLISSCGGGGHPRCDAVGGTCKVSTQCDGDEGTTYDNDCPQGTAGLTNDRVVCCIPKKSANLDTTGGTAESNNEISGLPNSQEWEEKVPAAG